MHSGYHGILHTIKQSENQSFFSLVCLSCFLPVSIANCFSSYKDDLKVSSYNKCLQEAFLM